MNGSWPDVSDKIDTDKQDALLQVVEAGKECNVPFLLIGAMARDILMEHVHGIDAGRRTLDVDIAVMVGSWREFSEFCTVLNSKGFLRYPPMAHRFRFRNGVLVDVLPFGKVADADGCIAWPPDHDPKMSVTGFDDAFRHCLRVNIGKGLTVNIVSLAGLAMLKLLAWNDRRYETAKDAHDLTLLLRFYGEMHQLLLFDSEPEMLERHGFDLEMSGAELLGRDMRTIASPETARRLLLILRGGDENAHGHLVQSISRHLPGREYKRSANLLASLLAGIEIGRTK